MVLTPHCPSRCSDSYVRSKLLKSWYTACDRLALVRAAIEEDGSQDLLEVCVVGEGVNQGHGDGVPPGWPMGQGG